MNRAAIVLVLFGLTAPASAEPRWSVHLGESVGLEQGFLASLGLVARM